MSVHDPGVMRTEIDRQLTKDFVKRLVLAEAKIINNSAASRRMEGELAHQAIEKTLSGKRVWKRDQVTLFHHLCSTMKSDLSHLRRKSRNVSFVVNDDDLAARIADSAPNQEYLMIDRTEREAFLQYVLSRNSQAWEMARLILNTQLLSHKKISITMGISEDSEQRLYKKLIILQDDFRKSIDKEIISRPKLKMIVGGNFND